MNNIELIKKPSNDKFITIKFIIAFFFFLLILFSTLIGFQINSVSNKILNMGITSTIIIDTYLKSAEEGRNNNRLTHINKSIDQFNNFEYSHKTMGLLMLINQINISLFQLKNIDNDVYYFSGFADKDIYLKVYKESIAKTSDSDMEIYKKYLSQLVTYYKKLEIQNDLGDNMTGKFLSTLFLEQNNYLNSKILLKLYMLNSNIEHWKEIKQIQSQGFDVNSFLANGEEYWKNNFAKEFGEKIPSYISIYYHKEDIDTNTAKNWINNYK